MRWNMTVLVVDDEELIRDVIREYLENEKYEVLEASDGEEAIQITSKKKVDLMILDIMMPKKDGYTTLKEIRKDKNIPVIMLSARKEEYDKLLGFDLGIDDYLTKPFSPRELLARVKAVLRRNREIEIYQVGDFCLDFKGHLLKIEGKEVKLTPKEYELLIYFIQNEHIALSREQLLNQVWGYDFYGDDRTIDTHIKMLRNNLGKYRDWIVTVRGMGYKFESDEKVSS